jgi:APA family basic amino acid/polyamine antiporter
MRAQRKKLGLFDAVMLIMGSMIGSGVFLAPSIIAGIAHTSGAGPGSFVIVWIVGGLLTLCAALSFGELASSMPQTGGQYVYLSRAFSPFWGYLYGWTLFTVIQSGFIAAVAVAFANYLGVFVPGVSQSQTLLSAGPVTISTGQTAAIGLILFLTWINSRGLRAGAFVQNLLGVAKIAALAGLILAGFFYRGGSVQHFQPVLPPALTFSMIVAFAVALSKVLFAYDSWNVVTFLASETSDSARMLPRALLFGTLGVTLIYTLTAAVYLFVLPLDQAAAVPDQRIAAEVARLAIGPAGLTLIAIAILISTAGCDNGLILSGPWLYYAMAKDRLFFRGAADLNPETGAPVRSLWYQAMWASALVLSGSFGSRGAQLYSDLLTFTSFASLLFNVLTIVGLFILRRREPALPRPSPVPAYPFLPALFIAVATFFLIFIAVGDPRNAGFGLLVIALGAMPYLYWRRRDSVTPRSLPAGT